MVFSSVELVYLLLIVNFCSSCMVVRISGVVVLMVIVVGISLIVMVVRFMINSVVIRVFLWLRWFLKYLKMVVLNGWDRNVIVNVFIEVMVVIVGFRCGKNMVGNISVVVVL